MAKGLNKVMLIGHLGKDPELKYTEKGTPYAIFSLATTESYKGQDGKRIDKTEWHSIVVWSKLAEICHQYLKKGSKIYCEGKLAYSTDEKDGVKRYYTKVVMSDMAMLDSKGVQSSDKPAQEPVNSSIDSHVSEPEPGGDSDLPF